MSKTEQEKFYEELKMKINRQSAKILEDLKPKKEFTGPKYTPKKKR